MEKYFRTREGQLVNIVEHTLEQVAAHNNLRIRIGTDAQDYDGFTYFVTVIVFRYELRGAHYIYYKERVPRIKSTYLRLYDEGVRTIQCFEMLTREIPISVEGLEFDFNDYATTLSSKLVNDFKGWTKGLGQRPIFKSEEMLASKAGDHLCRRAQYKWD